jgi:hypothetical protein
MRLADLRGTLMSKDKNDIILGLSIVLAHHKEVLDRDTISGSKKIYHHMTRILEVRRVMKRYNNRTYSERIYILAKLIIDAEVLP